MPDHPRIEPSLTPRADVPRADAPWPEVVAEPDVRPRRTWLWWVGRVFWYARRLLVWTILILCLLALVPPGIVLWLASHPPSTTAFMRQSEVQPVQYQWVPKEQIPESMRLAVIAAEDQKFWTHWGFDFYAIAEAMEHNERSKRKRGASTITQQTAKNLFLWPSRSWLRKGLEVTFTLLLEGLWTKDRILEVYLNVAEFGPGIYGVEAAAQHFFRKPAAKMTPEETARLAAVLPNPRKWKADRPGPYVQSRIDAILLRIGQPPRFSAFPAPVPDIPVGTEPGAVPPAEGAQPIEEEAPSAEDDLISQPEPETTPEAAPEAEPGADEAPATEAPPEAPAAAEPAAQEKPRYAP
jgi:monofunctional biosynthetic peptidoglycan transglycosylase